MPVWVRIIIVDFKSGPHLQTCITALRKQTYTNFEVFIVDNACPEGAARQLEELDDRFEVIRAPKNLGYAGGCNFGAKDADAPWLIMLNPDTEPFPDWLENLHAATMAYPGTQMFSSTLLSANNPKLVDGFGDVLSIYGIAWRGGHGHLETSLGNEDVYIFSPCGAAAMYDRRAFVAVNGFDTDFFCYIEDVDLGWRLRLQGAECIQVRQARCEHVGSVSTASNPDFRYYHTSRNTIWMIIKCAPVWLLPIMLTLNGLSHIYLRLRGAYKGAGAARFRGLRDGLRRASLFWKKRNRVQSTERGPSVTKWLVYSPKKLRRQDIKYYPISTASADDANSTR